MGGRSYQKNTETSFRYNIERIRNDMGITQVEMARLMGIGRSQYQRYRSGSHVPDHTRLRRFAKALKVDAQDFFGPPMNYTPRTAAVTNFFKTFVRMPAPQQQAMQVLADEFMKANTRK